MTFTMGEGLIGGGGTPPSTNFCISDFVILNNEKDFLQVLSNLSQTSLLKLLERKVVSVAPQISRGVFSDILATASRLNTLYGIGTLYVQSSRHDSIISKFLRHT